RVRQALATDAQSTLAADLVLVSDRVTPKAWVDAAQAQGLRMVMGSQFPSMAQVGEGTNARNLLAAIKTVTDGYPLRGSIEIQTATGVIRNTPLGLSEAWIDPALAATLNIGIGDRLRIGAVTFRVAGLILQEPDRGMNFVNLSPRVMIRHERLADTNLVVPGSRISYRLWLAAPEGHAASRINEYAAAVAPSIGRGQRLETIDNARPELRNALDRAYAFLSLTGMLASLTAAAAVALASQRFVTRHLQTCAVLKSLGTTQSRLVQWWALELFLTTLVSIVIGLLLGWLIQLSLAALAAKFLSLPLASVSWAPFAQAAGVAGAMILGFAVPPLFALKQVPAVRVLRQDTPVSSISGKIWAAFMLVAVWLLLWFGTGNAQLSLITAGGFAIAAIGFAGLSWLIFRLLPGSVGAARDSQSRLGLFVWAWRSTARSL
ncbi:MAG: ABC transporter permease, partial [Burkholderiales bacterium]